ncbi:MAG TPA: AbrB/MazE/SpoVT family DNA-binding domain-containing protein [Candidatus Lokiarchaeia archaeon]|nr:AbrB/MazE/SpoVT family DNA-binding domain-containing protein [Candidatus Lokiarchaeia archaeon]
MLVKSKLHASQLYIPKEMLARLSIGKDSEVYMEFDENRKTLVISAKADEPVPVSWFLDILANPPETIGGDPDEDLKEYDYDDI